MITKLPETIKGKGQVKGFTYKKSYESEVGYIYLVDSGDTSWYETFIKKAVPICIDFENRVYSEVYSKEVYPKEKDFGVWAWTVGNLNRGIEILNSKEQ